MPKYITAAVGQGGVNRSNDVMTIQYLLNCVPAAQGGPVPELAVDGMIGPKTIAAIHKFQKARFNWSDGRVDPGGKTLGVLQPFDPYPHLPLGAPGTKTSAGKATGGAPGKTTPGKGAPGKQGGWTGKNWV